MNRDRGILIKALEGATRLFEGKIAGKTALTQPSPDSEVLDPISTAIESCEAFKSVSGQVLFSANSGIVLHAPALALPLFYRARNEIPAAADWLIRLLQTRQAKVLFNSAIWGLSVDKEIPISDSARLVPFALLADSRIKEVILHRAGPIWNGFSWQSQTIFDKPRAALVIEVPKFPYICADTAAFKKVEMLEQEVRELSTLLEGILAGHPIAVAHWFDHADADLDLAARENSISWNLPEVLPRIPVCTAVDAQVLQGSLRQYEALPEALRHSLLRSMNRFTLSQCRHQIVDRVLDLTLAFEIGVSGEGDNAPSSWKVSVRSAQLIGGELKERQEHRSKIADLYKLRSRGTHGSSLKNIKQEIQEKILQEATDIYPIFIHSFLRLGKQPDWNSLELEPAFASDRKG